MSKLILIMASTPDLGIASKGQLPWNVPPDGKWFKSATNGEVVVMGTKTYNEIVEMIGGPLPQRINYVITNNPDPFPNSMVLQGTLDEFKNYHDTHCYHTPLFVIGGLTIIKAMLEIGIVIDEFWHTVATKPVDRVPDVFLDLPGFNLHADDDEAIAATATYTTYRRLPQHSL